MVTTSVAGESVRAFVPSPLPPTPAVRLHALQLLLEQANQALGRLDGLASILPDISLFIYAYVRKEAVLSSQIEGSQSSLSDLLLFENEEAPGVPIQDVQEVSNYVAALYHGLNRIREGFPLSAFSASHSRNSRGSPVPRAREWLAGVFSKRRERNIGESRQCGSTHHCLARSRSPKDRGTWQTRSISLALAPVCTDSSHPFDRVGGKKGRHHFSNRRKRYRADAEAGDHARDHR